MTPGVWLAMSLAALFGVITFVFAVADARVRDRRDARRQHPTYNARRRP